MLGAARELGVAAAEVSTEDGDSVGDVGSDWVLLSRRELVLQAIPSARSLSDGTTPVLWTDQRSDLFAILR